MLVVCKSDIAPTPSAGAPEPLILASDTRLILAYEISPDGAEIVVLTFDRPIAHCFGPPNDEAFEGHSLYIKGLRPHGVFEVFNSTWIEALEVMNRVHPRHDARRFAELKHFVFTFHDNTFECVAVREPKQKRVRNEMGAALQAIVAGHRGEGPGQNRMSD